MTDQPCTTPGDIAFWGLTMPQAAHHYARLSGMHARRSRQLADLSAMYAHRATITNRISLILAAVAFVLALISWALA